MNLYLQKAHGMATRLVDLCFLFQSLASFFGQYQLLQNRHCIRFQFVLFDIGL